MKNLLTFEDLTGKRRLRSFVKVAIGAFVLIVAIGVVNTVNRNRMMNQIFAEPRPVSAEALPTTEVVVEQPVVEECPTDPADWTMSDNPVAPGSNLKKLSTECVYNELEKTAAWVYATTAFGYTRTEAAAMLGLQNPQIMYFPDGLINVLTDYKDEPQPVSLVMAVNHPDLAEWRVNANGEPGDLSLTFNGCFRTSSVSGGEVTNWGNGYSVVCQFFADYQTQYVVSNINGSIVTSDSVRSTRRTTWFGYSGFGSWTWLGIAKEWDVDLSQISSRDNKATLDASVMAEKYGITALPLPQSWRTFTGQEFANAFLAELNGGQ